MAISYRVQFIAHLIQPEYTEYHIKVTSSNNESWLIRRRYSEFRELHDHLKLKYPEILPSIPGKRLWGNQDPQFVRERQEGLQKYMDGVLAIEPECRTRFLRRFLEIRDPQASPSRGPSLPTLSSPVPSSGGLSSTDKDKAAEKRRIISEFEEKLFNLNAAVALVDPIEEEQRRKKYAEIISQMTEAGNRFPTYQIVKPEFPPIFEQVIKPNPGIIVSVVLPE